MSTKISEKDTDELPDMTITAVSSPVYSAADNSSIDCTVTFNTIGTHQYTASAADNTDYGIALWENLNAGTYGPVAAYVAPTPSAQQLAAAAIAGGVIITSTGTPALNGTYDVDQSTQNNLNAIITYIIVNSTFPNSATTLPWFDAEGAPHLFPSVGAFQAFATAIANFVASVAIYANSNGMAGSIPSNAITIP